VLISPVFDIQPQAKEPGDHDLERVVDKAGARDRESPNWSCSATGRLGGFGLLLPDDPHDAPPQVNHEGRCRLGLQDLPPVEA
jgi:hypothetical protein